jgi:hypothetical protein
MDLFRNSYSRSSKLFLIFFVCFVLLQKITKINDILASKERVLCCNLSLPLNWNLSIVSKSFSSYKAFRNGVFVITYQKIQKTSSYHNIADTLFLVSSFPTHCSYFLHWHCLVKCNLQWIYLWWKLIYQMSNEESKITNIWPMLYTVLKCVKGKVVGKMKDCVGKCENKFMKMKLYIVNIVDSNSWLRLRPAWAILQTEKAGHRLASQPR